MTYEPNESEGQAAGGVTFKYFLTTNKLAIHTEAGPLTFDRAMVADHDHFILGRRDFFVRRFHRDDQRARRLDGDRTPDEGPRALAMSTIFELWDRDSRNIVSEFDRLDAAIDALRDYVELNGSDAVEGLSLLALRSEDDTTIALAEDEQLLALVISTAARR